MSAVGFRNVEASPHDPVATWPYEALVETLEQGLVSDWQPVFAELRSHPWGVVARRVMRWARITSDESAAALFTAAVDKARKRAEAGEREEVARRVRKAIERSGLTSADFAASIGTSASRLSTYAHGKVMPSAAMLLRIEGG
jgi:DNA-binding transcriptional regulator YiaG